MLTIQPVLLVQKAGASQTEAVIGIALAPLDSGAGLIPVMVTLR